MSRSENEFIALIAEIYRLLGALEEAIGNSAKAQLDQGSPVIRENITQARQAIAVAIEHRADKRDRVADIYAELAYLRVKYAAGLFETEQVEALLGEGDFLQLTVTWQTQASEGLNALRQALTNLQSGDSQPGIHHHE